MPRKFDTSRATMIVPPPPPTLPCGNEVTTSIRGSSLFSPEIMAKLVVPDRVFSAYDVGAWKPDPRLFLHAADALGVAPGRCAVVEDSRPGIEAGVNAGMHTFWFRPHSAVPDTVTVLHQLADLPHLLA